MRKNILILASGMALIGIMLLLYLKQNGEFLSATKEPDVEKKLNNENKASSSSTGGRPAKQTSSDWASASTAEIDLKFNEIKTRAEAGNAEAQRLLAEMYERCSIYSISPENFHKTLDDYAKTKQENSHRYEEIKKRFSHYCGAIDGGQVIPNSASELWYAEAAKRGDLIAQLKVAITNPASPKDYQGFVARAIASKDPEAIFALEEALSSAPQATELGQYGPESGGAYSEYSWALAGCRAGVDCGAGSYLLDSMCINFGACNSSTFEALIRNNFVPPGQLKFLDRDVERIGSKFKPET